MTELMTSNQMRALENSTIESGQVTGLELMERAGQGVVDAIYDAWPEVQNKEPRALVLCGPGNNGGDGFVVARLLKLRGWQVDVFLFGDAAKQPVDARTNHDRWNELGATARMTGSLESPERYDVIVDAVFGTGLSRGLEGQAAEMASMLYRGPVDLPDRSKVWLRERTVAVDVPSGYCADSGKCLGDKGRFEAALTVTFHTAKTGHYLSDLPDNCGRLVVKDIGLGAEAPFSNLRHIDKDEVAVELSSALRKTGRHKFDHGHALVLSGEAGRTGAARLAARGALRIGAGLVTLAVPPAAQLEVASQITAIMLQRVRNHEDLTKLLRDERLNALCLGPGFGTGEKQRAMIATALGSKRPVVLDADALTVLSCDTGDGLFEKLHAKAVLTPHGGEFARLFPDIAEKLDSPSVKDPAYSKVDAAREAAARTGSVVLFKGPDTVIAAPDGRCSINAALYDRSAPWLATAGSGDVLAGFIAGLLARGYDPMSAAETGAWLHVECARSFGPGLIAEDISEELPKVLRTLTV